MWAACVINANELREQGADLIVFPEGVSLEEMHAVQSSNPSSIVIGAVAENGHYRGVLLHLGVNQIDYLKVLNGGGDRPTGTGNTQQNPVWNFGTLCIGVLICMDIDHEFAHAVIGEIQASRAKLKVLCIPADMQREWDVLMFPKRFEGIYVVLCNHTKTYHGMGRCKSFIANTSGNRIEVQREAEPIYADLP